MIKYIHNNVSNLNGYIVQNSAARNSKSNLELISKIEKILSIKSFLKKRIYDLVLIVTREMRSYWREITHNSYL